MLEHIINDMITTKGEGNINQSKWEKTGLLVSYCPIIQKLLMEDARDVWQLFQDKSKYELIVKTTCNLHKLMRVTPLVITWV